MSRSEAIERVIGELRSALAPDQVSTGADVLRLHGTDESWLAPVPPDVVVLPRSTAEAATVVGICAADGVPIIPFGAGTSLEGHVHALRGGVCVDMSEMNAILRLSAEDFDVTVEAGVTRRQLDARVRPEGLFFPIDPGADATLGGMVSTRASGTTTVRYGAMPEHVLALTVVMADGSIVHTGSRARKSSTGYDLTRLFVGAEGTLGLITEITLKLHPTPEAMVAAVCSFPTMQAAVDCVIAVLQNAIPVARIELIDGDTIAAINAQDDMDHPVAPTIFFELAGTPAGTAEQAEELAALTAEYGAPPLAWSADERERRRLWHARHQAYPAVQRLRPGSKAMPTDVCVPISRLAECIHETRADIEATGLVAPLVGHVGDGNFHLAILLDPDDAAELAVVEAFHDRLVRRALAFGGTCSGEHGIGYGKAQYLEEEHGPGGVALMRAIKSALDPHDLFNPGKLADWRPPVSMPA